jgi:hypothetical protein
MYCNDRQKEHAFLGKGSVNIFPAEMISEMLLANGSVNTPTTIGVLWETVFSIRSVHSGYKEQFS